MTDRRDQPDALPDADLDESAIEQVAATPADHPATDIDDLDPETSGPNDAGVTASGAE